MMFSGRLVRPGLPSFFQRIKRKSNVGSGKLMNARKIDLPILFLVLASCLASAQPRRKIIINEDCSGPGGSNMQTLLVLIQSPQVEVLGITVVSGDQWRDEEVAHTLRLLEIIGRTDIPVVPTAVFPGTHFSSTPAPDFGLHFPGSRTARRTREPGTALSF